MLSSQKPMLSPTYYVVCKLGSCCSITCIIRMYTVYVRSFDLGLRAPDGMVDML